MLTTHRYRNHLLSYVDGRDDDFGLELYQAWFTAAFAAGRATADQLKNPGDRALQSAAETARSRADVALETYQEQVSGQWRGQLLGLS